MTKKWILETNDVNIAEFRSPKPGEYYLGLAGLTVYRAPPVRVSNESVIILHPVADDCVMVPRDRILILEQAVTKRSNGNLLTHVEGLKDLIDACWSIVRCAGPEVDPKDEILEALREVAELACSLTDTACDEEERCAAKAAWRSCDRAIAFREAELKARKSR